MTRASYVKMPSVLVLCFFVGCSHMVTARIPSGPGHIEEPHSGHEGESVNPVVKVGMPVEVYTRDGEEYTGEVVAIGEGNLVIGKVGNYGFETIDINLSNVKEIRTEVATGGSGLVVGVFGAAGLALGAVVVLVLLFGEFGPVD